jgi:hypothetical protein
MKFHPLVAEYNMGVVEREKATKDVEAAVKDWKT